MYITTFEIYYMLQMGSMFKPSVFDQFALDLISDWVGERSNAASTHSHGLRNQPQLTDEIVTTDHGTTASVVELSSLTPIPEQV